MFIPSIQTQENSDGQAAIERLKSTSDEINRERDQLIKSLTGANKTVAVLVISEVQKKKNHWLHQWFVQANQTVNILT